MKMILAALNTACAAASPAFVSFDVPPFVPPHSPTTVAMQQSA
jgi:hypothetical protein